MISIEITQAELDQIYSYINSIKSGLSTHLVTLEKKDRMRVAKLSDHNFSFTEKSLDSMLQNPNLAPKFVDVVEMGKDLDAVKILRKILAPLKQITADIEDSILLAGSEAYTAALAYYHSIKGNMKMNVSGAETVYDELSKQFAKKSVKKTNDE